MSIDKHKQVSIKDTKLPAVAVVKGAKGHIKLEIHKGDDVQTLKSDWFNFYTESWRTVVKAFFGENTGAVVPAVALWAYDLKLEAGKKYEIGNGVGKVLGIFGKGRPGAIGGDGFGKGVLTVAEISSEPSSQYIKGSFEFTYIDFEGGTVKVVAKEFWAKYSGVVLEV